MRYTFFEKDVNTAIKQIVEETFSFNLPISVNISNEMYNYFDMFCILFFNYFLHKKIAVHIGAMDIPDKRKVHTKPMPRLGGLGIFLTFLLFHFAKQNLVEPARPGLGA